MRHRWVLIGLTAAALTAVTHAQEGEGGGEENQFSVIDRPKGDMIVCTVSGTGPVVIILDGGQRLESPAAATVSELLQRSCCECQAYVTLFSKTLEKADSERMCTRQPTSSRLNSSQFVSFITGLLCQGVQGGVPGKSMIVQR